MQRLESRGSIHRIVLSTMLLVLLASYTVGSQSAPVRPRELVSRGDQALAQRRYYDAVEHYTDATEANPRYFDALYGLARAYSALEEYDVALQFLESASDLAGNDSRVATLRGHLLVSLGRVEEAETLYRSVIADEPNNLEALIGLAELDLARGRTSAAVAALEEAVRLYPSNRRALLSLFLIYDYNGDEGIAERYLQGALRYHRTDAVVHILAAEHYLTVDEPETARLHAMTALTLSPENPDALLLLARSELTLQQPRAALAVIEQLVRADPTQIDGFYLAGWAHVMLEEFDQAIRMFQRALRIDPQDELIRLVTETILLEQYPIDDPVRESFSNVHFERGASLRLANRVGQAVLSLRRALLLNPFHRDARAELADVYRTAGYRARYLQELEVIASLGETSQMIDDAIEVYRSVLADSVSADWGVDQFERGRDRYRIGLFVDTGASFASLPGISDAVAGYLQFILLGYENVDASEEIVEVGRLSDAFAVAREQGVDFFALVSFADGDRTFRFQADLHLARTGALLRQFQSFTAGNTMVADAIYRVGRDIQQALPFRAELVQRDGDRGLISAGSVDGVAEGDTFAVLPGQAVLLAPETFALQYPEREILGEFVVTGVDDLVAEGTIRRLGLFDMVNTGDLVVVAPSEDSEDTPPSSPSPLFPPLYNRVRELRN